MSQPFGRSEAGDMGDDRIHHILNEASHMLQKPSPLSNNQKSLEDSQHSIEDSKSPPNCTSPFSKRNMKKYENDDISEEKLHKIYQEEFQKLMARGQRDAFPK